MSNQKSDIKRLIIVILLLSFYLGFILINVVYKAGILFMLLNLSSLVIMVNYNKISKNKPGREIFAIQKNWYTNLFVGILAGVVIYFVITSIPGLSLLTPETPASAFSSLPESFATVGQWLTNVIAAPLVEEITFRTVLFATLYVVIGLNFYASTIISSLIFALYHINAYAGEIALSPILANQGAFITAFLVGILLCFIDKYRKDVTAGIGIHGAFNALVVASQFVII